MNLALAAGAPIKVDNALFDNPDALAHMAELSQVSVATAAIASEVEEEMRKIREHGW